jgi:hypothetical protein
LSSWQRTVAIAPSKARAPPNLPQRQFADRGTVAVLVQEVGRSRPTRRILVDPRGAARPGAA